MSIFDLTGGGAGDGSHERVEREIAKIDRQRAIPVQTQTKAQVEAALEKRLKETCAEKRATLALESPAGPGVSKKQGSLF